jgi:Uma2 family endonuclease
VGSPAGCRRQSPGSGLTDRVTKRIQYAEAGIAHYWIIDLDPPVSLTGYLLVDGDYEVTVDGTGVVDVTSPAPLHIELDTLIPLPLSPDPTSLAR